MKPWMILGLSAGLCACVFNGHASAANFYTISGVTTNTVNYYSELNLIQGPGVGFDANVPHDAPTGALTWVTNDPGGYPSDYIAVAGQPIIELDLGKDVNLEEISTWGYSAGNTNGVSQFSLRFATEAEGPTGYGTSITFNPTYSMIQDPVPRQSFIFGQSITARYVEFTALDNFYVAPGSSGGDRVGLGEIAFATAAADQLWIMIDRETGNMAITNQTSSNSYTISGYDITSTIGALDSAEWLSIAANYDADSGGTIDPNNKWIEFGAESDDIAEGTLGALTITPGMTIDLGNLWIRNPAESMQFVMLQEDGTRLNPLVRYIGNNDLPFEAGDLNFDGAIDALDWPIYRNGYHADLSALSGAQAYQQGDMNFDGVNNVLDYTLFKTAYETANGPGSFDAMLAGIPEPAAWILFLFACASWAAHRFRVRFRDILVPGLAAAICSMVIGLGTTQADLPSIVSHWTLDADGSDSVGTNNGTPNEVTFGQAGANANTGTAALFNGSTSTINVPYSADLNPTSFTAVLWANAAAFDDGHHSPLTCRDDYLQQGENVSTHGYIIYNAPNGIWEFWTGDGDPGWASVGGGSVATSTWTHLAISFDSFTKMKSFYVNGTLAGSTTLQGYSPNGTVESEDLHIGSGHDLGDNYFFNGLIDDVAVYEGVLNQAEIQHVANNGVSAFELIRLTLQVNADTGATSLRNDTGSAIDIDQYEILSAGNALNASGWYSLQDQDYEGSGGTSGQGDGWEELGTPGAGFVGEAYLQASSNLVDTTSISLGSLFNPAGPQDLVFNYRLADGTFWDGVVEYVTGGDNADFDADGDVDGADFLAWQIGFGTTGSATRADGDANGDTNVNGADLAIWKTQFGMGGVPNGLTGTAIPEPSTLGLFGLACICLAVTLLRHRGGRIMNKSKLIWIGMVVVLFTYVQNTLANSETDRLYHLGDDPWDGAVANNAVTLTADSYYVDAGEGDRQNLEDYYFTEPTYVNVGSGPYARSGASPGDLGIRFDGTDDFLIGDRLGYPADSVASMYRDYSNIEFRGFQLWVYADSLGGTVQDIVMDTNQHGVRISTAGNWVMLYGSAYESETPVVADTWHHVLVVDSNAPGAEADAYLFVDGIATWAATGSYGLSNWSLVLGASAGDQFGDPPPGGSNFFNGVLDELEMFIMGVNGAGYDYGTFNAGEDNDYIAAAMAGIPDGDITGDGNVTGDGTGNPATDDVAAFVQNWKAENLVNNIRVGDLVSRMQGDFNYDGIVDLFDWHILRTNHPGGANLNLGELLAGAGVPEPSAMVLLSLGAAIFIFQRYWHRRR